MRLKGGGASTTKNTAINRAMITRNGITAQSGSGSRPCTCIRSRLCRHCISGLESKSGAPPSPVFPVHWTTWFRSAVVAPFRLGCQDGAP